MKTRIVILRCLMTATEPPTQERDPVAQWLAIASTGRRDRPRRPAPR